MNRFKKILFWIVGFPLFSGMQHTVDACEILHQLKTVLYPVIGFQPSKVMQDFYIFRNHPEYFHHVFLMASVVLSRLLPHTWHCEPPKSSKSRRLSLAPRWCRRLGKSGAFLGNFQWKPHETSISEMKNHGFRYWDGLECFGGLKDRGHADPIGWFSTVWCLTFPISDG